MARYSQSRPWGPCSPGALCEFAPHVTNGGDPFARVALPSLDASRPPKAAKQSGEALCLVVSVEVTGPA
jgi:hypothetical protein